MFLPHIMLGWYGWPGFLLFAIPNVLGCASFGYVLNAKRSARFCEDHRSALTWFSLITIAFHLFFVMVLWRWLTPADGIAAWPLVLAPAILMTGSVLVFAIPDRYWPAAALLPYVVSLGVWFTIGPQMLPEITWRGNEPPLGLLGLAPIVIFGFLLCPYLDLTFHRACQQTPSRHAFAVFGVTFGAMIIMTCAYWQRLDNAAIYGWLVIHIFAQAMTTVGVHLRELERAGDRAMLRPARMRNAVIVIVGLVIVLAAASTPLQTMLDHYLRFFVFYGLVFPSYVAVVAMTARGDERRRLAQRVLIACVLLAPLCELGFLHGQPMLLIIPVAVMLAWALCRRLAKTTTTEPDSVPSSV